MEKALTLQKANTPIPITYTDESSQEQEQGMSKKTKLLVAGLTLGALGVGTYAYFQWRGKNNTAKTSGAGTDFFANTNSELPPATKPAGNSSGYTPAATPKSPASDFPIKKGSRSDKVKQLQQGMMTKFGASLLPKYGADGQYGSELENAFKAKGIPTVIDEQTFKILTQIDTTDLATKLYDAAKNKDYAAATASLKQVRNAQDYKTLSEQIKKKPSLTKYSNNSLVNIMLYSFTDATQKQALQLEFGRMGLSYDGTKWTLPEGVAGLPAKQVITSRPTKVWIKASHPVSVGANTVLGTEVVSGNGITVFDSVDGFRLYVMTSHVRYL